MFRYCVCAIRNHPKSKEQICRNSSCCRVLLNYNFPANIHFDEDVLKTSFVFLFRRRLDQEEYIRLSHTSSEDIFKTSSRRSQDFFKTSLRCLAKTSSRRLQDVLKTSCKNDLKKSSRPLQDVLKTLSRPLAKISSRSFQDVSLS